MGTAVGRAWRCAPAACRRRRRWWTLHRLGALRRRRQLARLPPAPPQVLSFAGELLANAESLLRDGLHPTEIADGYAKAGAQALDILDTLVVPGTGARACLPGVGGWRAGAEAQNKHHRLPAALRPLAPT